MSSAAKFVYPKFGGTAEKYEMALEGGSSGVTGVQEFKICL